MLQGVNPLFRPVVRLWLTIWSVIYYIVAVVTYVGLISGAGATAYYSFIDVQVERAILGGLCTLLIIYVNKVNPS